MEGLRLVDENDIPLHRQGGPYPIGHGAGGVYFHSAHWKDLQTL